MRIIYTIALAIAVVASILTLLACGENSNWESLEAKQDQETLEPLSKIFSEAYYYVFDEATGIYTLFSGKRKMIGYAFYTEGSGYIGQIDLLVGLKDKQIIKGILVVSQNETPQYWEYVVSGNFFLQFRGVEIERCYVNDWSGNGGQVDSVSGATKSAYAIIDAVRETAKAKVKLIK